MNKKFSLMLRTCNADMTSYSGFKWPTKGLVVAPDWNDTPNCGHGLHGLLWGEGDGALLNWGPDAVWVVAAVETDKIVQINGKIKVPRAYVVKCGDRKTITDYLAKHGAAGKAIIGFTATAGHGGTATAGYRGTATAGYGGTATAGHGGTATAGYGGTLQIKWYDDSRYRIATAYVGENNIQPNTPYKFQNGLWVKQS